MPVVDEERILKHLSLASHSPGETVAREQHFNRALNAGGWLSRVQLTPASSCQCRLERHFSVSGVFAIYNIGAMSNIGGACFRKTCRVHEMSCKFCRFFACWAWVKQDAENDQHSVEDISIAIVQKNIDLARIAVGKTVDTFYEVA
jgi:hypothetical protein